jgi:hypothetical protein
MAYIRTYGIAGLLKLRGKAAQAFLVYPRCRQGHNFGMAGLFKVRDKDFH